MRGMLILILVSCFGLGALAQGDSLPFIFEGEFNWSAYKREVGAPSFNQKDLVMYTVQLEGLSPLFNAERDKDWVDEFHFLDLDGDNFLDLVFSGELVSKEGSYTLILMGDSVLSMHRVFEAKGYLHAFEPDETGITFTLRRDGRELSNAEGSKEYLTQLSLHRFEFEKERLYDYWQLEFPYLTKVPPQIFRESAILRLPTPCRWLDGVPSAKIPVDLDGDGEMDTEAALNGVLEKGSRVIVTSQTETDKGEVWSFVISLDPLQKGHVYSLRHKPSWSYAGWVKGDLLAN